MVESYGQRAKRCLLCEHKRDPRRALAPTSPASGPAYSWRAHQPLSDPLNSAPPRREECESRSTSLFLPDPPDPPGKTERLVARGFPGAFWKQPACLACLTWPALAEPLLDREKLLDRLHSIGGEEYSYNRGHFSLSV